MKVPKGKKAYTRGKKYKAGEECSLLDKVVKNGKPTTASGKGSQNNAGK